MPSPTTATGLAEGPPVATPESRPPACSTSVDRSLDDFSPQLSQMQPLLDNLSSTPRNNQTGMLGELDSSLEASSLEDLMANKFPDCSQLSGQWTPMGPCDFGDSCGFELDDADLRFLEAYNNNLPFELDSLIQNSHSVQEPANAPSDPCRPAALGTEAYRNYYWKFRPNVQDHGAAEEHNLSLPSASYDRGSPESRISLDRRITSARLTLSSRDKILTCVMQSCRTDDLSRVVESFPAAELLDTLLQYYLTSPIARSDSFLHVATFDPNKKRPELLAAMIAAGAVLTSDPALCKLGLAIQECQRVAIPRHWERNNALTRDLELWQAYLIVLEVGLWSGHSRKVEIAESFLQPLVTMVRRDGKFKRSGYAKLTIPGDSDDSRSLDSAWRQWIECESFKRLIFRIIDHDTNASFSLLINPLISYADIQLPIPDPAKLWAALNPHQWKASMVCAPNSSSVRPLTLTDYTDNTENFHTYQHSVDTSVAISAFLSCFWRLTWEYTQLRSLQRAGPGGGFWNASLLSSRHEEMMKLLSHFRISADSHVSSDHQMTMRLEHSLMHLHMPFDELQLFAGMDGLEQARHIYPTVNQWARGYSARKAIWHGGQVLQAAKQLPKGAIWGAIAIIVYHASLVLWVYGLLSETQEATASASSAGSPSLPNGGQSQTVYLDGPENIAVQGFLQFGRGSPCIRSLPTVRDNQLTEVPLTQPNKIMETVAHVLRRNHAEMVPPHLVQNLIHLIGGLQNASGDGMLGSITST
ncbi:hypothetical protein HRR83_007765 [Exophiala dermatitidis]|uniref:Xylanolytic transcriptional activator regulatory domain-containing protein n=1 Tax=Exophiala dermatitidis TaxID=5970 RepID=A0AAN6ESR3_EXODE|nr:hypothetical protein HRR75_006950 [Exophiala dermatitidis]KAJ4508987.1 hypothetical protein HRR74_007579 [Exophiala dermatitidis]KAJ4510239.1 hypothetical protein HRR73_007037 [Exophiala dermatitidis]KAJ4539252.1 hypothetical protein HRR77_006659 [Exophiala dermatitidis]KAJ4540467.1 hypothetical protein HRR76_003864 [Exophiala dermatitidis]